MNRKQMVLIAAVVLLAGFVAVLALRNPKPPWMPRDADHLSGAAPCLECHGPDGGLPRGKNHPIGEDCLRCHRVRRDEGG